MADPAPNAPQLVRLIRFPFALRPEGTRRTVFLEEAPPPARVDARAERTAALAERERVRFTSPARNRLRPFAARPSSAAPIPPLPDDESSR